MVKDIPVDILMISPKVRFHPFILINFKGALLSLRQFLAIESPFKMMKNVFYLTLKALFVLKIFKFLS